MNAARHSLHYVNKRRYILRYPQSCIFFMKDKTVVVGFAFGLLLNFFVILYICYILLTHGDIGVNQDQRRIALPTFIFVIGI